MYKLVQEKAGKCVSHQNQSSQEVVVPIISDTLSNDAKTHMIFFDLIETNKLDTPVSLPAFLGRQSSETTRHREKRSSNTFSVLSVHLHHLSPPGLSFEVIGAPPPAEFKMLYRSKSPPKAGGGANGLPKPPIKEEGCRWEGGSK